MAILITYPCVVLLLYCNADRENVMMWWLCNLTFLLQRESCFYHVLESYECNGLIWFYFNYGVVILFDDCNIFNLRYWSMSIHYFLYCVHISPTFFALKNNLIIKYFMVISFIFIVLYVSFCTRDAFYWLFWRSPKNKNLTWHLLHWFIQLYTRYTSGLLQN